ncbi:recombinase family protein [Streptomyces albidoflavus]
MNAPDTFRADLDLEPWLGYVRVSTWKEEQISPELQKEAIRAWASRNGVRIVDWIEDLDKSGRNFKRRIMECIERVEAGEVRGVAVWRYSRFGRDRTGNAINLARLQKVGGRLESATEPVDANTAVGKLQRGMILEFAAYESDRAGEAWIETHDHRRAAGLPASGRRRWGYTWFPRRIPDGEGGWILQQERYEVIPEYREVHSSLYDRYIAGATFTTLTRDLNAAGYTTVKGSPWEVSTLSRWMDSGWAAGLLRVHDRGVCRDQTCTGAHCGAYTFIQGAHEPSIAPTREEAAEKWKAYQARRATAQKTPPRLLAGAYPVTGLVRCGRCRGACRIASYTSRARGRSIPGYALRCLKRDHAGASVCQGVWSRRKVIEDKLFEWLAETAADDIDAQPGAEVALPQSPVTKRADRRRTLERSKADAEAALARLMVDRAKNPDLYPEAVFRAAKKEIDADVERAVEALGQLDREETSRPTAEDLRPVVVGLLLEWETFPGAAKNAILKQLVRRVVIAPRGEGDARHYDYEVHPVWEPDPWSDQEKAQVVTTNA